MTFDHQGLCRLENSFAFREEALFSAGLPGALNILLLGEGEARLPGGEALVPGQVVLANGPLALAPAGFAAGHGAALAGRAAQEARATLTAPLVLHRAGSGAAASLLEQLTEGGLAPGSALQSALCYQLLCLGAQAGEAEGAMPPLVAAAIREIREHYGEVYGIEEVAATLGVSKSHLIRRFTAWVGVPPGRYLTAVRIETAKGLLLHPEYSLDSVAGLCGFSGANYLCRVFKKETGLSPGEWRSRNAASAPPPADEWEDALYL